MTSAMDIDDILADLDHPSTHSTGPSLNASAAQDLQLLTRAWIAERACPELLEWPTELMERVMERVSKQIEKVEDEVSKATGSEAIQGNFRSVVMQADLERLKYLVRSFLRARLAKVDRFPLYYSSPPQSSVLSTHESQYLQAHQSLLNNHFSSSFMSQFPDNLRGMDDTNGGVSMIDVPDEDKAVFVRVLRDVQGEVRVGGTDVRMEMRRGDVWVARWRAVKQVVERGEGELL